MTLKLNGSSSGSVSIDAPANTTGGADIALTLPENGFGKILQVVQATTTTSFSSTTVETDYDTNLSGSITTTGSNKVLVLISQQIVGYRSTTGAIDLTWKLQRSTGGAGYSVVYNTGADQSLAFRMSGVSVHNYVRWMASMNHLDSPGAGTHTYKTTLYMTGGEVTVKAQENDHPSTITMMEVAV